MNLFELQQEIKTKHIPKFLVFTGNEYAIINLYINQISKQHNLMVQNISRIDQVIKQHAIVNILGANLLYVCRYDIDFVKNEKLWQNIDAKLGTNYLILILSSVDNRSKFSKCFEKRIVEFNEQSPDTVKLMLNNQIKLIPEHLERLMKGCNFNYSKIVLEIDKIKNLAKVRNLDDDDAYEQLLIDKTICESQDSKLQEFVDNVMCKRTDSFRIYKGLIENGESNLTIIAWLYNAIRNQLSVQTVNNPSADTTGLNFYFIKECLSRKGIYTVSELLQALKIIKYCEQGIKNGLIEEQSSVNYILVNLL